MAAGVQLSFLLLAHESPATSPQDSCSTAVELSEAQPQGLAVGANVLRHCARTYLRATLGRSQTGLNTTYYTILSTSRLKRKGWKWDLGKWYPAAMATGGHVMAATPPLEELVDALSDWEEEEEEEGEDVLTSVANQIHSLMDCAPINSSDYVIVNFHWVAAGRCLSTPSEAIALFGALLRLRAWHRADIEIVIPDNTCLDTWHDALAEWEEALGVARVCPASQWSPLCGVLWRGDIIAEQEGPLLAPRPCVHLPGYTLHLAPDVTDSALSRSLLERVGLWPHFGPSHLKLLGAVDVSTVPSFWISPLHCKLLPAASSPDPLKTLLDSRHHSENVGCLFSLCQSSTNPDPDKNTCRPRTTADWVSHLQSHSEELLKEDMVHPLSWCEDGPVLLVESGGALDQSDTSGMSRDAWFLWQPDSIDASAFTAMRQRSVRAELSAADIPHLPPPLARAREQWTQAHSHELDAPLSECQELRALQTYEWIQRKMVKETLTSDLMFGHLVAPPPSHVTGQWVEPSEMLGYFTENGAPVPSRALSPIAVTTPSKPTRIHNATTEQLTYRHLMTQTPRSRKCYHGVDYCLSEEDSSTDHKLTAIQQHCLLSERASHCSNVTTPRANRRPRRREGAGPGARGHAGKQGEAGEKEGEKGVVGPRESNEGKMRETVESKLVPVATAAANPAGTKVTLVTVSSGAKVIPAWNTDTVVRTSRGRRHVGRAKARATPTTDAAEGGGEGAARSRRLAVPRTAAAGATSREPGPEEGGGAGDLRPAPRTTARRKAVLLKLRRNRERVEVSGGGKRTAADVTRDCDVVMGTRWLDSTGSDVTMTGSDVSVTGSDAEVGEGDKIKMWPEKKREVVVIGDAGKECPEELLPSPGPIPSNSLPNSSPVPIPSTTSIPTSPIPIPSKSPRKPKRGAGNTPSKGSKKRDQRLKTLLGRAVVRSLKSNGMPRTHPDFRTCYSKLFKLSKLYMEDLKSSLSPGTLQREISRVVEENVGNVIVFQQRFTAAQSLPAPQPDSSQSAQEDT